MRLPNHFISLPRRALPVLVLIALAGLAKGAAAQERLWTFGDNSYDTLMRYAPWFSLQATPGCVPYFTGVVQAEGGGNGVSMVLLKDGTVWFTGLNQGQFGAGNNDFAHTPVQVPGLSGVKEISFGGTSSAALKSDGTVWITGDGTRNWIDMGPGSDSEFDQIPLLSNVAQIKCGSASVMARLQNGEVWGVGASFYYKFGQSKQPVRLFDFNNAVDIDFSGSFFVVTADGTLWGWGQNNLGQLGDGTTSPRDTPAPVLGLPPIASVISTDSDTIALAKNGTVWAWGNNGFGQLGIGTVASSLTPAQVPGLTNVVQIGGRFVSHTLALKKDGTVWGWGYNGGGELGDGTNINRYLPVQCPNISRAIRVFAGGDSYVIALPTVKALSVSPATIPGGVSAKATVTIDPPASLMGEVVNLTATGPLMPLPATLNVAAGSPTATFAVTAQSVAANQPATIKATYAGSSKSKTVTIAPPTISSVILSSKSVYGGENVIATVLMTSPPLSDVTVTLGTTNSAAHPPASLIIHAGSTGDQVTVTTDAVSTKTAGNITATLGSVVKSATLTVNPVVPLSVTLPYATFAGGPTITATVTLTGAVLSDTSVAISNGNAKAHTPTSVSVPAGSNSATFSITTDPTTTATSGAISATLNGATKSATLKIVPPVLLGFGLDRDPTRPGETGTAFIRMSGPVAVDTPVTIVDNCPGSSFVVPHLAAGQSYFEFPYTADATPTARSGTVKVTVGSKSLTVTLRIIP